MDYNFLNPLFLYLFSSGLIFLFSSFILNKASENQINNFYGYRTKRSMASIESWNFSQKFSARIARKVSIWFILLSPTGIFVTFDFAMQTFLGLVVLIIGSVYIIAKTENALKEFIKK